MKKENIDDIARQPSPTFNNKIVQNQPKKRLIQGESLLSRIKEKEAKEMMSKAIRILPNMPNDCGGCDIRVWTHDLGHICPSMGVVNDYIGKCRPGWCPLKPEPELAHYTWCQETEWQKGFYEGYMDCYHEIFGDDGWRPDKTWDEIIRGGKDD